MAWTNVSDANLAADAPARSADIKAIRDNITAVANGDAGAPPIQAAAFATDAAIDSITAASLGSEKFQTGTDERDWVLARIGASSAATVGTYSLLVNASGAPVASGDTVSGASTAYAYGSISTGGWIDGGGTISGTWRNMQRIAISNNSAGLFLRIS